MVQAMREKPSAKPKANEHSAEYLSAFEAFEKKRQTADPAWLKNLRRAAIQSFNQTGFPTTDNEAWKYTNVSPILKNLFHLSAPAAIKSLSPLDYFGEFKNRIVFVNGFYHPGFSSVSAAAGTDIGSLAQEIENNAGIEKFLAPKDSYSLNGFTALNTAFLQDGAWISLAPGTEIKDPIHVLYVSDSDKTFSHLRTVISLGKHSSAKVIERFVSLKEDKTYFNNSLTQVFLAEGAKLEHFKIQDESEEAFHIASINAQLDQKSRYASYSISIGVKLVRNDLNVIYNGEEIESTLNGLYLVRGTQHVDNHTMIDHAHAHGTSRQLYKGILDGKARSVFNGKVFVRQDAQQTDARQTNKNLLLSDGAIADTKPELEIAADDVKCSHGAAIGQLDEDSIFYLKSRAISEENARGLLTYGYASEVIDSIPLEPLRTRLYKMLWGWLKDKPAGEMPS